VARATLTGHKLSAVALQMQDDDVIQQVRTLLDQLDLEIPQETRFFSLPRKMEDLQKLLIEGIQTIEKQHQDIVKLDTQREELQETHDTIYDVTLDEAAAEPLDEPSRPKTVPKKNNVTRMIYPHQQRYKKNSK
jgi:hypothetical protein